jgi:hypothetical protein
MDGASLTIEPWGDEQVALVERIGDMVKRRTILSTEEAKHLFFDGVKLCVELERRERG